MKLPMPPSVTTNTAGSSNQAGTRPALDAPSTPPHASRIAHTPHQAHPDQARTTQPAIGLCLLRRLAANTTATPIIPAADNSEPASATVPPGEVPPAWSTARRTAP